MELDRITLKSLRFHGKHGYYDEERENGNEFEIDLIAKGEFKPSIQKSDLSSTFDYQQAEEVVRNVMEGPSQLLIETLCTDIGERLFKRFGVVDELIVSVRKLHPPIDTPSKYAEITMTWNR